MTDTDDVMTLKTFASEHGIHRHTVGDVIEIHGLPCQQIGRAKMITPKTQRRILKILGIKPGRQTQAVA